MPNICNEWHTVYLDDGIEMRCGRFKTTLPWPFIERFLAKPPKERAYTFLADGTEVTLFPDGVRVHAGRWGSRVFWPKLQLRSALDEHFEQCFVC